MTMSGRDRAGLRAEAHHLTPLVHVGQYGLSPTVIQALDPRAYFVKTGEPR